jgi:endonuclease YncB( thermonuclease family)
MTTIPTSGDSGNYPVPTPNWCHPAVVVRVIDGDTLVMRLDLGMYPARFWAEASIRVNGLYCRELDEPGGKEARDFANAVVANLGIVGWVAQTVKPNPRDPYGRIVADLWMPNKQSYAEAVIAARHGKPKP